MLLFFVRVCCVEYINGNNVEERIKLKEKLRKTLGEKEMSEIEGIEGKRVGKLMTEG